MAWWMKNVYKDKNWKLTPSAMKKLHIHFEKKWTVEELYQRCAEVGLDMHGAMWENEVSD